MKLWFFRTPENRWGYCDLAINKDDMEDIDGDEPMIGLMVYFRKPPWWNSKGFPPINPGECVPVELVPAGKTEKKKVRKS